MKQEINLMQEANLILERKETHYMTRKIFYSIFLVALAVLSACTVFTIGAAYDSLQDVQKRELKNELMLACLGVEKSKASYLKEVSAQEYRFTWIGKDGGVLYDSVGNAGKMENHYDRKEVKEAFETGEGESIRYSSTIMEETIYFARLLEDGTVLRISAYRDSVFKMVLKMLRVVLIIFSLSIVLSWFLAKKISKKIVEPLNSLDFDHPLNNDVYDEVVPMLKAIETQHEKIKEQKEELDRKKNEFQAVTGNMKEGLLLLNENKKIISMNPSARDFFHVNKGYEEKYFIEIERNTEINRVLSDAAKNGTGELTVKKDEKKYQINISRIAAKGSICGFVILIFDVTDKAAAEKARKEFTANVSHELKTPLQSIMGSAELIENNMVKPEDMPRFIGYIRKESRRLLSLIQDIISISRLDEEESGIMDIKEEDLETIDLYEISKKEVKRLSQFAKERDVTLNIEGESAILKGQERLINEIVSNLCENAIKYNVPGGEVWVKVMPYEGGVSLTVEDTGIGIPSEHKDRVFERFYRVDKSRSKKTGGTGLGLSIVKHAVALHHGTIKMESEEGRGTKITVII